MNIKQIKLILIIICISLIRSADEYYKTLELQRDATEQEIKQSFRKLSKKYHPDRNPGNQESNRKFVEINKAYEILSDQEKRQIYDIHGEEGLENQKNNNQQADMFGQRQGYQKGPNAQSDVPVTLEELYNGRQMEFTLKKNILCPICRGTGAKDGQVKVCTKCHGHGVRMETVQAGMGFTMQMQVHCDKCAGKGKVPQGQCTKCGGKKVVENFKQIKISIEKGMKDNHKIVFNGEAEQNPNFLPGDVIFTIKQKPHDRFQRVGDNLFTDLKISLKESLLGFSKEIRHLDGRILTITNQGKVIQPFQVQVVQGEGMPVHENYSKGDLHVKFIVTLPHRVTQGQLDILNLIFQ